MLERRLNGQVALVTGGGRGLGRAICLALAREGARIAPLARGEDDLQETSAVVHALGGEALPLIASVADYEAMEAAIGRVVDHWGRLDVVVNNAGVIAPIARVAEADPAAWRDNVTINLIGPFNACRAALPYLLRQGSGCIVNVSSGAARRPITAWSAYCAAKAGLDHFTRVLVEETRGTGVRVNAVYPGVVDTRMQAEIRASDEHAFGTENLRRYRGLKEQGQLRPPEQPATLIAWMVAQPDLHGEFLSVDDAETMARAGLPPGTRRA